MFREQIKIIEDSINIRRILKLFIVKNSNINSIMNSGQIILPSFCSYPSPHPLIPFSITVCPFQKDQLQQYQCQQALPRCQKCLVHRHPFSYTNTFLQKVCPFCHNPLTIQQITDRGNQYDLILNDKNFQQLKQLPRLVFVIDENLTTQYRQIIRQSLFYALEDLPQQLQVHLILMGQYIKIYTLYQEITQHKFNINYLPQQSPQSIINPFKNTINNRKKLLEIINYMENYKNHQTSYPQLNLLIQFLNKSYQQKDTIINIFINSKFLQCSIQQNITNNPNTFKNISYNIFLTQKQSRNNHIEIKLFDICRLSKGIFKIYKSQNSQSTTQSQLQVERLYYQLYDLLANNVGFCHTIKIRCTKGWKAISHNRQLKIIKNSWQFSLDIIRDNSKIVYCDFICIQVAILMITIHRKRVLRIINYKIPCRRDNDLINQCVSLTPLKLSIVSQLVRDMINDKNNLTKVINKYETKLKDLINYYKQCKRKQLLQIMKIVYSIISENKLYLCLSDFPLQKFQYICKSDQELQLSDYQFHKCYQTQFEQYLIQKMQKND